MILGGVLFRSGQAAGRGDPGRRPVSKPSRHKMSISLSLSLSLSPYIYIYIYICACLHLCLYMYMYMCMSVHIYIYIYTHIIRQTGGRASRQAGMQACRQAGMQACRHSARHVVRHEHTALAQNTAVLREAMLLFLLSHSIIVTRRVCGHVFVKAMLNKLLLRLSIRSVLYQAARPPASQPSSTAKIHAYTPIV